MLMFGRAQITPAPFHITKDISIGSDANMLGPKTIANTPHIKPDREISIVHKNIKLHMFTSLLGKHKLCDGIFKTSILSNPIFW